MVSSIERSNIQCPFLGGSFIRGSAIIQMLSTGISIPDYIGAVLTKDPYNNANCDVYISDDHYRFKFPLLVSVSVFTSPAYAWEGESIEVII